MNILGNLPFMNSPAKMAMKMVGQMLPMLSPNGETNSNDPLSGIMSALLSNPSTSSLLSGLGGGGGLLSSLITLTNPAAALAVAVLPEAMKILGYDFAHLGSFFCHKGQHAKGGAQAKPETEGQPEEPSFMDQAESILGDKSLSIEEKLMRLASLAADKIDDKTEKEMKEWSKELDSTVNKGKNGQSKSNVSKMDKSDRNHYFNMKQMEIQQLLQKKRELMSTVTQISKALFSLHQQIISNIR